jgi:hypothetical protein
MYGKGIYTAQEEHLVNILPPVDITGGKTGQPFFLGRHGHATIVLAIGVSAAAFTKIIVNACSDAAADNPVAIPFSLFTQETSGAGNDVLSGLTAVPAAGYTPSANANIFYVIELDADQLPAGKPYVQLDLTNGANSVIASAVALLSGARYENDKSDTVTT